MFWQTHQEMDAPSENGDSSKTGKRLPNLRDWIALATLALLTVEIALEHDYRVRVMEMIQQVAEAVRAVQASHNRGRESENAEIQKISHDE